MSWIPSHISNGLELHNAWGTGSHLAGLCDPLIYSPCPHTKLTGHNLALLQKPRHHSSTTVSLNQSTQSHSSHLFAKDDVNITLPRKEIQQSLEILQQSLEILVSRHNNSLIILLAPLRLTCFILLAQSLPGAGGLWSDPLQHEPYRQYSPSFC